MDSMTAPSVTIETVVAPAGVSEPTAPISLPVSVTVSAAAAATVQPDKKAAGKGRAEGNNNSNNNNHANKRQRSDQNRRAWGSRDGNTNRAESTPKEDVDDDEDGSGGAGGTGSLGRKRKVALAVMYRGTAYCGLQLQNGPNGSSQPTIERELMDAIYAAGGISKDNMNDTQKIKWQRAARTDKGVHAAGNILSLMMIVDGPPPADCKSQSPSIVDRINAHLPTDIRVIGWCRTLGGFHSKFACTSRVYEYIIPSFVFDSRPETVAMIHSTDAFVGESAPTPTSAKGGAFIYDDRLLSYRLSSEKQSELRSILALFRGTLNYQNFTRKKAGFLKEQAKERPKWVFKEATSEKADGEGNMPAAPTESHTNTDTTSAHAKPVDGNNHKHARKSNKDDAPSDDEGEGLDDLAEEAMERAAFAARLAGAAPAAGDGNSPSPFANAHRKGHNLLFTNLKSTAVSKGGNPNSQTNKVSGQYARFIRYIMDFDIEETYVHHLPPPSTAAGVDPMPPASSSSAVVPSSSSSVGLELVRFRIHGQSFMLNQIRKMMGLVIIVARGQLPVTYITEKAFKYDEYAVPTAPSLGLLLQRPVYDAYDKKVQQTPDRATIESLFISQPYKERVDAFRSAMIYQQIGDAEVATGSAYHWCSRLWNNPARAQYEADEKAAAAEAAQPAQANTEEAADQPMPIDATSTAPTPITAPTASSDS